MRQRRLPAPDQKVRERPSLFEAIRHLLETAGELVASQKQEERRSEDEAVAALPQLSGNISLERTVSSPSTLTTTLYLTPSSFKTSDRPPRGEGARSAGTGGEAARRGHWVDMELGHGSIADVKGSL